MPIRYASDLAPEEVLNEGSRILAQDRARLAGTNYPVYRGQTISPMSSLTQKARTLQSGYNAKAAPYSGKINQVLNRPNQGINPRNIQEILDNTGQQQQNFSRNGLSGILNNQFRDAYDPTRLLNKSSKDIRSNLNETSGQLGDIQRSSNILEQSSNQSLVDKLRALQAQKQDRRKGLIGSLEQFGAQKHGYNNLVNAVNRNSFEQEANAPFRKMDMLQNALSGLGQNMDPNVLPELQNHSGKQAIEALRAYGIDTNKSMSEWENSRTSQPSYPGQLIAPLPAEIQASHSTLEAINPKFKGSQYEQQKALIRQMMANPSIGDTAMAAVPERMRGQVSNLESSAQKRLKRDLGVINNQFIQANQYGSPLHIKTAEDRAREVGKSTIEQRSKMLEDNMISELSLGHQQQQANLRQTGTYGDQAQREYEEMLEKIRNVNNLGANKFANEQGENEDLYKNFQNEAGWEWPHLKGAIAKESRQGALGDVFRGLESKNISLDNLAALNTRYSESQKEAQGVRNQLQTRDSTIADLERQLGTFRQQHQTNQAAETQRREQQQRADEAQRQQRNQANEAQRLEALRSSARYSQPQTEFFPQMFLTAMKNHPDLLDAARNNQDLMTLGAPLSTPDDVINTIDRYKFMPMKDKATGRIFWEPIHGRPDLFPYSNQDSSGRRYGHPGFDLNDANRLRAQRSSNVYGFVPNGWQ